MKITEYKIAILTQPLGHNYGGIIQNFALQKVLVNLGHSSVTIDRRKKNTTPKFRVFLSRSKSLVYRYIFQANRPTFLDLKKIESNNHRFIKQHIRLSPRIETTSELLDYFKKEQCTAVVVGSDQVWRPRYSPNIYNFYLDFLENDSSIKKVAYAASFGTEEWEYTEEQTNKISNQIQQFDAVSVREDSGVLLCDKYLNRKDAVHVLDPTLLLNAEDYSQLINQSKKDLGLFTYVLDLAEDKNEFIITCAQALNLQIHTNQAKLPARNIQINQLDDYIIPPIEGWLQGFRDAEFVITDSFHGTVFSILNQKPFISLVNAERGASRFTSFLSQLGLEDRLVFDVSDFDMELLKKEIDYTLVQEKLDALKASSFDFLKRYF